MERIDDFLAACKCSRLSVNFHVGTPMRYQIFRLLTIFGFHTRIVNKICIEIISKNFILILISKDPVSALTLTCTVSVQNCLNM